MTPRRHPSAALIADYATGRICYAPAVTVAAHLQTCSACHRQVRQFEEAEGRVLEAIEPATLTPGSLERILDRLRSDPESISPTLEAAQRLADVELPDAVKRAGLGARRWLAPGLWTAPVRARRTDDWRTFLLRVPAGTSIPSHRHRGGELIAVLSGSFSDGETFTAGDFGENTAGSNHEVRVGPDAHCVCLISIQGRAQWRGWARVITPVLGI